MSIHGDMEKVFRDLLASINHYNSSEMLDGYMNDLAEEYNERLDYLGMPRIEVVESKE